MATQQLTLAQVRSLIALNAEFCRDVPQEARGGRYGAVDRKRFARQIPVPNGRYRVTGSDWILTIDRSAFAAAERAVPPHYGGPDVIPVAPPEPKDR